MIRSIPALSLCVVVACSPAPPNPVTAEDEGADPAIKSEAPITVDTKFGHFAFAETSAALGDAGGYRDTGRVVQLRTEAADAFVAMQKAAGDEGVSLVPISGYRTFAYQDGLFGRAINRYGSPEEAAVWVAPPGYSEHHTGLALDIGDLDRPETDVEVSFEETPVFEWLKNNADRFGFELSFPVGNPQGVSYEPWHWRFVGEIDAVVSPDASRR